MHNLGDVFKSGDRVPHSGIYRVLHSSEHQDPHEVTCVYGRRFPSCRSCEHTRFMLLRGAESIDTNNLFKIQTYERFGFRAAV